MKIHCPTCQRTASIADDAPYRPFCSERCKLIDLGRWLAEDYRISRPISADDPDEPTN